MWSDFTGCIIRRATMSELENENVKISLFKQNVLMPSLIAEKIVDLRGIFDFQRIKTELTLIDPKTKDKFYSSIEGFVNIDHNIRYKQSGDNVVLLSNRKYLCLKILKVENIRPAETKGIVDSFISVEWVNYLIK